MQRKMIRRLVIANLGLFAAILWLNRTPKLIHASAARQESARTQGTAPVEGDYVVHNFHFRSGESLPEMRLHFTTLGKPARDGAGHTTNAVLMLHGTNGTGGSFLIPQFGGVLFGPGQLLDANRYYIIMTDSIGAGKSSKPSDGLRARFPHYDYADMVLAQRQLLQEKLGVDHLRLIISASMGCMHVWMWGEMYPDAMDAMLPLVCQPVEIGGRNRMSRRMIMDLVRDDPGWKNGDYTTQPKSLRAAIDIQLLMVKSPLELQTDYPTRDAADKYMEDWVSSRVAATDANDMLYQFDSSWDYDPSSQLGKIQAYVTAINSADDFINPPELGNMEREIAKVKHGRYVLLPISSQSRGHGSAMLPVIWQSYLAELLQASAPK